MKEEDLIKFRKEHGDIKIRGKNIPKPIFNWYQCGLSDKIMAVLERKEFKAPFPIQCQAISCIMSGRDVIGIAETGSGKTLAYVLPMIRHVLDQRRIKEGEGPIGFVMVPTRELATQIHSVIKPFAKVLGINAACVYGGAGIGTQITELRKGAEIVVCTPGRMIEMLCMSGGRITNLQRVYFLIYNKLFRLPLL
jgi:ATP-dependent RNA helicase DDX46/PRP5